MVRNIHQKSYSKSQIIQERQRLALYSDLINKIQNYSIVLLQETSNFQQNNEIYFCEILW